MSSLRKFWVVRTLVVALGALLATGLVAGLVVLLAAGLGAWPDALLVAGLVVGLGAFLVGLLGLGLALVLCAWPAARLVVELVAELIQRRKPCLKHKRLDQTQASLLFELRAVHLAGLEAERRTWLETDLRAMQLAARRAELEAELQAVLRADLQAALRADLPAGLEDELLESLQFGVHAASFLTAVVSCPSELRARRLGRRLVKRLNVLMAELRPYLPAKRLSVLANDLLAELRSGLWADLSRIELPTVPAELPDKVKAEESLSEAESLRLRAARLARVWSRFGFFLPPRSKELLQYDLAEHAADFYEALAMAEARQGQRQLAVRFTIRAVAKVLDCTRVALHSRLQDEFRWVASRLPWD